MKKQKAFTLIELMLVIVIIGVIASIILVATRAAREKARIAKGLQFSSSVHHALGAYAVGIWDFNDQANPTVDASGNSNNGTINGAAYVTDTPSGKGYALEFNRSENDWIKINGDIGLSGAMTISLWFKTPDKNTNQYFADNRSPGTWWFIKNYTGGACGSNPGNICFENRVMALDSDWRINEWTHIVVTDDTSTARMYINGKLVDTGSGQSTTISTNLRFGTRYTNSGYFQGLMDDPRVYEQALDSAQIRKLYAEGLERHKLAKE